MCHSDWVNVDTDQCRHMALLGHIGLISVWPTYIRGKGPINNIPSLAQIMAWHRPGNNPLSEPMMISLLMHICVTQPQWVNNSNFCPFIWGNSWKYWLAFYTEQSSGEYRLTIQTKSGLLSSIEFEPQISQSQFHMILLNLPISIFYSNMIYLNCANKDLWSYERICI